METALDAAWKYRSRRGGVPEEADAIIRAGFGSEPVRDFAESVAAGLSASPPAIESRFLYDDRGSRLFEEITRQPEYYLTRIEASILAANSHRIRRITGPVSIIELGSGSSCKTDYLLRAWMAASPLVRYLPVDVSMSALEAACRSIAGSFSSVRVTGINADYRGSFHLLRRFSPSVVLFLGSSIGNFSASETDSFLRELAGAMEPGDFFLVGIDLVKEPEVIDAAYNDAAGVTAEFTRNLFHRMNRELGSGIDVGSVHHLAVYNPQRSQVEIGARFATTQTIRIAPGNRSFRIPAGGIIRTEISRKFHLPDFVSSLGAAGFDPELVLSDERNWFSLILARRRTGQ